jgi:RHS repeat-associated protein
MQASTWNGSSDVTTDFAWNTSDDALLSDTPFDYVYGVDATNPIAQIDKNDTISSELLSDTNSNICGIVELSLSADSPFTLANYTDYDSYGNSISESGGIVNSGGLTTEVDSDPDSTTRIGFGQGYEDSTGLIYLVHRYYDPAIGQFVSLDPDISQTGQPYAYAGDAPSVNIDPSGEITPKQMKQSMWLLVGLAAAAVFLYNADVITTHWVQHDLQVVTEDGGLLPNPEDTEPQVERIWTIEEQAKQGEKPLEEEFRDLQGEIVSVSRQPITTSPSSTFFSRTVAKVAHISDVALSDLWHVIDQPAPTNIWSLVQNVLIGVVVAFVLWTFVVPLIAAFLL